MALLDAVGKRNSSGGKSGAMIRFVLRFFQFVLAITVAGLYGVDLHHATKAGAYIDGKWVFAEVCAGLAALTTIAYGVMFFLASEKLFMWDWVLFILWTTLFGIFGRIFIPANPTPKQAGQIRMKHAVWVDLLNMILWLVSASYATVMFWRGRGQRAEKGSSKV